MSSVTLVVVALGLVAANGFFVAMEFALLAARRGRIEEWVEEGRAGSVSALAGMRSLNVQLAACQLGITVMSLMLGWIIEPVVGGFLEDLLHRTSLPDGVSAAIGVALGLTFVSFVHMVLGEMVPKSVALAAPERSLVILAPLNRAVTTLVKPLILALNALGLWGTRLLRVEPADELAQAHTPEELDALLAASAAGGELDAAEHGLLSGALGFLTVEVRDVMAPAGELVTVPATATIEEAEDLMHRSGHSRVLVTADDGQVLGFLHAKDLLRLATGSPGDLLPPGITRVALKVRPDDILPDVLQRMRRAKRHVAVVVDDGTTVGLLTLEDLLEAIVGDIRDESDRPDGPGTGAHVVGTDGRSGDGRGRDGHGDPAVGGDAGG